MGRPTADNIFLSKHWLPNTSALLWLFVLLQSCSIGPDFHRPDFSSTVPEKWHQATVEQPRFSWSTEGIPRWWEQFQDDQLTDLIKKLHRSSIALAQARERIVEMNARQGVIDADKQLQLAAALGYTHAETGDDIVSLQSIQPGKTLDIYSTGLTAGWEADLWGRTARLLEAGEQDIRISHADYQAMLVSLAAEVSLAYFDARTLEARKEKVAKNLELQKKTRALVLSRYEAGNGSALEVTRSDRLISITRARLPELERALSAATNRLKVLLGLPPQESFSFTGKLPAVPHLIGMGLPADLLTRRPDINKAFHTYHAAVARIGAAEADKYPSLTISGTLTLSTDSIEGLLDSDSLIYTLGPAMHFPILTGNRIEANIAVRKSQAEQARLGLEQQIIAALAEVENSAVGVVRTQERVRNLEQAEKFAIKSVQLADELYRAGLGNLYEVLDNQQQLVTIQESLLQAKQQALGEVVALYRALGGGWEQVNENQVTFRQ